MGTFFAFLWTSNWYEWYVSEGPGDDFKVRLMALRPDMRRSLVRSCLTRVHPCSHGSNFPNQIERILQLEISVDLTFANHVAVL